MKVIPIDVSTPFGRGLVESIENVDDDSRFISVEEFMRRYGHLLPNEEKRQEILDTIRARVPLRVIHTDGNTPFGRRLAESIKNIDDDSRFISADEFLRRYGHLIPADSEEKQDAAENAERLFSAEDWTVSSENDYSVSPARRAFLSDPDLQHFLKTGEAPKYDIEPYLARVPNKTDNDLIIWRNGHAFATPKLLAQFQDDVASFENEPVIESFIEGETYQDFRKRMDDIGGGTDE